LLADVAAVFAEVHARMAAGEPIGAAIASRSDEPAWARECLRKFLVAPGVVMNDVVPEVSGGALPSLLLNRRYSE
jgi:hypothetical protein